MQPIAKWKCTIAEEVLEDGNLVRGKLNELLASGAISTAEDVSSRLEKDDMFYMFSLTCLHFT